jgi:hypothetical protein
MNDKELDSLIKKRIKAGLKTGVSDDCLTPDDFNILFNENTPARDKERFYLHVSSCSNCLETFCLLSESLKDQKGMENREAPKEAVEKAKARIRDLVDYGNFCARCNNQVRNGYKYCPNCGYEINGGVKNMLKRHIWLIAACLTILLSLIAKRYFMQFLTAALIMGFKWAFDPRVAKTIIMSIHGKGEDIGDNDTNSGRDLKRMPDDKERF